MPCEALYRLEMSYILFSDELHFEHFWVELIIRKCGIQRQSRTARYLAPLSLTSVPQRSHDRNMFAVTFRGHRSAARDDLVRQATMLRGRRTARWPPDHDEGERQENGQKAAPCRLNQRVNEAAWIASTVDSVGRVGRTHGLVAHKLTYVWRWFAATETRQGDNIGRSDGASLQRRDAQTHVRLPR